MTQSDKCHSSPYNENFHERRDGSNVDGWRPHQVRLSVPTDVSSTTISIRVFNPKQNENCIVETEVQDGK